MGQPYARPVPDKKEALRYRPISARQANLASRSNRLGAREVDKPDRGDASNDGFFRQIPSLRAGDWVFGAFSGFHLPGCGGEFSPLLGVPVIHSLSQADRTARI